MSRVIKSPRGMNDLLPPDSSKWVYFEHACRSLFERFGYLEVRTPVVESTELFARGIGEATDIVEKEMYTFPDRKGRSLTMRPEMTAGCARAYIEHAVHKREPVTRWFYCGPMFRYERMQTGRYRQFYQVGAEAFGSAEPSVDAEQIAMCYALYSQLGVPDLDVAINSVGTGDDRERYRRSLLAFLTPHRDELCADCQRRLDTNPLRILDCKVSSCRLIVVDAPSVLDDLGDDSRAHFEKVRAHLDDFGIEYRVDPRIVRGLDYYTGTVFEILGASDALGTQSTLVGGGRYDTLVEGLGGPVTPAVGFALGVERAILSLPGDADEYVAAPLAFLAAHGDQARARAMAMAYTLRVAGLRIEVDHRGVGLKAQFKRADKLKARFVVTLGEDELASGQVKLRDMNRGQETPVALAELEAALKQRAHG
ncbi:histidine--tRNA ligase [Haliangium sp.]|uniref:histidine--tRNA ligase n=1 Tax=Haliangium sp. TaxID=2663208 RepID=UPI003D11EBAB